MRLLRFAMIALLAALPFVGGCAQRLAVEGRSDRLYAEAKGALESEGFRPVGRGSDMLGAKGSDPSAGRLQFLYYADNLAPTIVEIQIEPGPDRMLRCANASSSSAAASRAAPNPGSEAVASAPGTSSASAGAMRDQSRDTSGTAAGDALAEPARSPAAASTSAYPAPPAPPPLLAVEGAPSDLATPSAVAHSASAASAAIGTGSAAPMLEVPPPARFTPGLIGAHRVVVSAWSSMTFAPDPFIADLAVNVLRRAYMLSGNVR